MKELMMASYPSRHAAYLAQTVLSRQQSDLDLPHKDIAVITRDSETQYQISESLPLGTPQLAGFWKILTEYIFSTQPEQSGPTEELLQKIGIDSTIRVNLSRRIPVGSTAILLLTPQNASAKVASILKNCQGDVYRIDLKLNDSERGLKTLILSSATHPEGH